MSWIDVGALADIPVLGARIVKTDGGCIALFRTAKTDIFAVANSCAHKAGPLSEGLVHGQKVTCPLHGWVYSLETGEAQGSDEGRIATFPVRHEAGRVFLDTASLAAQSAA